MIEQEVVDKLHVKIYADRAVLGKAVAKAVADKIRALHQNQDTVAIVFAAAPSQNEFLEALAQEEGIQWNRVNAFHMDEYIGLPINSEQRFGNYLKENIFGKVNFNEIHYLNQGGSGIEEELLRYSKLLEDTTPDIVCMGIGENTHLAFNDPHVADFNDSHMVKVVNLDETCRQQQVNDGCFTTLDEVPRSAITLTIPALTKALNIFCIVPGTRKAEAVLLTLTQPVGEDYPATILRNHSNATLYLDADSSQLLRKEKGFSITGQKPKN